MTSGGDSRRRSHPKVGNSLGGGGGGGGGGNGRIRPSAAVVAFFVGCGLLFTSPATVTAYVTVTVTQAPSAVPSAAPSVIPSGAPSAAPSTDAPTTQTLGSGSPTSAPSLLESPGSFTKEPVDSMFDDDGNINNNTTTTNVTGGSSAPGFGFGSAVNASGNQTLLPSPSSTGGGLSSGAIVGVAFGGIAAGLLLALAFVYLRRRKERMMTRRSTSATDHGLEVKKFSTGSPPASPGRSYKSAVTSTTGNTAAGSGSGSSKDSKGEDDEDGSDTPDQTEYSFTVSSSREGDEVVITAVSPSHPSYRQHALRALEEGDDDDMDDEEQGDGTVCHHGERFHDEADNIMLCDV